MNIEGSNFNMLEMLPQEAALTILARMQYSDIDSLCVAGDLFAYRFCGGKIEKKPNLQYTIEVMRFERTAAMYVMLLQRDWGISRNPRLCRTSVPEMRERVAASMSQLFPPEKDNDLDQIVRMRAAYLKLSLPNTHLYQNTELFQYAGVGYKYRMGSVVLFPMLDYIKNYLPRKNNDNNDGVRTNNNLIFNLLTISGDQHFLFDFNQRFGLRFVITSWPFGKIYYLQDGEIEVKEYELSRSNSSLFGLRLDLMPVRSDKYSEGTEVFDSKDLDMVIVRPVSDSRNGETITFRGASIMKISERNLSYTSPDYVDYDFTLLSFAEGYNRPKTFVFFYLAALPPFDGKVEDFLTELSERDYNNVLVVSEIASNRTEQDLGSLCFRLDSPGENFRAAVVLSKRNTSGIFSIQVYYVEFINSRLRLGAVYKFVVGTQPKRTRGFNGAILIYLHQIPEQNLPDTDNFLRIDFDRQIVEKITNVTVHLNNLDGSIIAPAENKTTTDLREYRIN